MSYGNFGQLLKERRLAAGFGLREFCVAHSFDPAFISRLERGRVNPPSGERLEQLAAAVGLVRGTESWREFMDQADVAARRIPVDLLEDEEAFALLPAVFRTFRNDPVDDAKLAKLRDLLRKA